MQGFVRLGLGLVLLAACALAGCQDKAASLTRSAMVGDYVYKFEDPEDKPTVHEFDRLKLQTDGTYQLVQGGSTKAKSEKAGSWRFIGGIDGDHAEMLLGSDSAEVLADRRYPVQVGGNEIRLMIDDDTGIWWQKMK